MNKYQILKVIGDGTYGKVYEGVSKETNEKVAIKKLKNKINSWEECIKLNEVKFLRKLNNENIVKLKEVVREQNSDVSFIFEYCDCNLFEFIEKHRKQKTLIPVEKIRNIIYQLTLGIKYLHSQGVMHRDLKPENVLLILSSNKIKIADFGTAKEIPEYKDNSLSDYVCTRWYRSPECVLKSRNYDEKSDVWAIGCIMAELYSLKPLFPGIDEFDQLNKIVSIIGTPEFNTWPDGFSLIQKLNMRFPNSTKKNFKEILYNISDEASDLLDTIFQYDPKNRPSCAELLKHPYFSENQRPSSYNFQGQGFQRYKIDNDKNKPLQNYFKSTSSLKSLPYAFNSQMNKDNFNKFENEQSNGSFPFQDSSTSSLQGISTGYSSGNEEFFNKIPYGRMNGSLSKNGNNYRSSVNSVDKNYNNDNGKNNYNYYKNFNFSNYLKNNSIIPDIDDAFKKSLLNLQNNGGDNNNNKYSKYSTLFPNANPLTNSLNGSANSKFSSYAKNGIMQNIKREKPVLLSKLFSDEQYQENKNNPNNPSNNNDKFFNVNPNYKRNNNYNNDNAFLNEFNKFGQRNSMSMYNYGPVF